jgi:hypothetical protein
MYFLVSDEMLAFWKGLTDQQENVQELDGPIWKIFKITLKTFFEVCKSQNPEETLLLLYDGHFFFNPMGKEKQCYFLCSSSSYITSFTAFGCRNICTI